VNKADQDSNLESSLDDEDEDKVEGDESTRKHHCVAADLAEEE